MVRSISTMRPSSTANSNATSGRPLSAHTRPALALDERGLGFAGAALEGVGHGVGAADLGREREGGRARADAGEARGHGGGIGADHHVGIEHGEQRGEIVAARGGEEGRHDLALARAVGLRRRGLPCTRRRARLASWRAAAGERPTTGAMSSNGRLNMSCSTKATRSAGARVSSTTSMATPIESAISTSRSASSLAPRSPRPRRRSAPRGAPCGAQHVEADARHHGGQPAPQILHAALCRRRRAAAKLPAPHPRPRRASPACGRPPRGDGHGWPRTARPEFLCRPSSHSRLLVRHMDMTTNPHQM